jgi:hypothetical protein
MDPYLEEFWGDVHTRVVLHACDQFQGQLPSGLRARVQERVFVDNPDVDERGVWPVGDEPVTETFIEIIDIASGRQVVAVIEILSPANKRPGAGQDLYLKKLRELNAGRMSLVEIDLLRTGQFVLSVQPRRIHLSHRTPYRVVVRRRWTPWQAELYPVALRERLPAIRVPLRETDADMSLDLQAVLERCYDNGAYQDDIDYEGQANPPLEGDEAAWADVLLREKGRRRKRKES